MLNARKKIACVVGTRPEAVKMAPLIVKLKEKEWANVQVISTGQHRDMLTQTFNAFGISVDKDLDIMTHAQTLAGSMSKALSKIDVALDDFAPELVLAQGDTTTVAAAALCSFYRGIPFGHVEAGLRTGDIRNPFPEELNRIIAGQVASLHFSPTKRSADNLIAEGVPQEKIFITGNTVIDALYNVPVVSCSILESVSRHERLILVTAHRRENHGGPLENICMGVKMLHDHFPDICFVIPVHPNPVVRETVTSALAGCERINIVEPLDYVDLVNVMRRSFLILTDSGGIQEEAPALSKPVLVLRDTTERPEAIECGSAKLIGTNCENIFRETSALLNSDKSYEAMAHGGSPYGDGFASERIAVAIKEFFNR